MNQKKYLVTGGAGFIGYWLVKKLAEDKNNQIFVVDNLIKITDNLTFEDLCSKENITFLRIDISENLDSIPKYNFDIIFHLAAFNGTQNFYNRPFDVIFNSTIPTLNLLKWCLKYPPKRFVFASTSETYAAGVSMGLTKIPTNEKAPLIIDDIENPRWSYASSKINGESAVISASKQNNLKFTIIRYHNVYGPRMGVNHIIPDYINRVKKGKYELYGGDNMRSFLYIEDAIIDTIKIANTDLAENQIINIGSNEEYEMLEVAKFINKIMNINSDVSVFKSPEGSVLRRAPDLTKINNILGERERVSFKNGLEQTINYYGI